MTTNESGFCEPVTEFKPCDLVFKIARSQAELEGFWGLRREIFCEEQKIFLKTDVDEHDKSMIPIVALSLVMGMEDEVVGVVRIHEQEPGVWYGSRLGVHRDFRRVSLSSAVPIRNQQSGLHAPRSVGAGLIYKAVSTANALGCKEFFAHVQRKNAAFFRRLHWKPLGDVELHGIPHVRMQVDLNFYPPGEHDIDLPRVA